MIHLTTDTRLSLVLPGTNKAFAEAIKNATPEQLATMREEKGAGALLGSLFRDKIASDKSDRVLMDILKNAPVFKNMGNFPENLAALTSQLRSLPQFASKTAPLEAFLQHVTALSGESLKSQLSNSGVFMEGKIAEAIRTLPALRQTLRNLETLLASSTRPEAKNLAESVRSLLEGAILRDNTPDAAGAARLASALRNLGDAAQALIAKNDVVYAPQTALLIERLASEGVGTAEAKTVLGELYRILLSSTSSQSDPLLDTIEKLMDNLARSPDDAAAPARGAQELSEKFARILENADPSTSRELPLLLAKLEGFGDEKALILETILEKSLGHDMKSQLMQLHEELQNTPGAPSAELLERVDKLLVQIDYHQLLSHLNNSNSIYFPFSWDLLEEGSLGFKKSKEERFYCEINLRLREYGGIDLMMALFDHNQLEIQAHTEKASLKELLEANLPLLRGYLIDAGITPRRIRILQHREASASDPYASDAGATYAGFEVTI